ncbi:hypothetical protein D3C74_112060 [compost metagenome]
MAANVHGGWLPPVYLCLEFPPPVTALPAAIQAINDGVLLYCIQGDGIALPPHQFCHYRQLHRLNGKNLLFPSPNEFSVQLPSINDHSALTLVVDVWNLLIHVPALHYLLKMAANVHGGWLPPVYLCLEFPPPATTLPAAIQAINDGVLLYCIQGDGIALPPHQFCHYRQLHRLNGKNLLFPSPNEFSVQLPSINDHSALTPVVDDWNLLIHAPALHYLLKMAANVHGGWLPPVYLCLEFPPPATTLPVAIQTINDGIPLHCIQGDAIVLLLH